jgi:hypothetical protein
MKNEVASRPSENICSPLKTFFQDEKDSRRWSSCSEKELNKKTVEKNFRISIQ